MDCSIKTLECVDNLIGDDINLWPYTNGGLKVKMGFDPTKPDLHLGHLVGLLLAQKLQKLGHQIQLVIGSLTATIGDPSGSSDRKPLTEDEVIQAIYIRGNKKR